MIAGFLSLVINAVITFVFIVPHLNTLFFPLDKPIDKPIPELLKAHKALTNLSVVRWTESFAGLICTFIALNTISYVRSQQKINKPG